MRARIGLRGHCARNGDSEHPGRACVCRRRTGATGNAAYVYPRAVFDAQLEPLVMANRLRAHDDLKRKSVTLTTINHSQGWQRNTRDLLLRLGVRKG